MADLVGIVSRRGLIIESLQPYVSAHTYYNQELIIESPLLLTLAIMLLG